MAGTNLNFSKVVATPTTNAWSQAYSAGSLFAAISLENQDATAEINLNSLGKDVISTLESEFFTVENKDLESIKVAVNTTISKINEDIKLSFVICYLNENILYLYAAGDGKAILKRGEKIGTVIDSESSRDVKSASGYVQDNDYIILETKQFQNIIASSTLASALDKEKVDDISEILAPHVHEKEEGGASAIVLSYKENSSGVESVPTEAATGAGAAAAMASDSNQEEENEEKVESSEKIEAQSEDTETKELDEIEKMEQTLSEEAKKTEESSASTTEPTDESTAIQSETEKTQLNYAETAQKSRRRVPKIGLGRLKQIPRRILLIIGVIIIILVILIGAFLVFGRGDSVSGDFDAIYSEAREKYEEGLNLKELNESLAQENFIEAQNILQANIDTFPQGSDEDNQIEDLLDLVNQELGDSAGEGSSTTATEVDSSESRILELAIENDTNYLTENDDFIFFITDEGVTRIDKGNDEEEIVVEEDWAEAGGIGVFGSNIYVLDKEDNIFKFVPGDNGYSKTDYITGDVPSLTGAAAMAIDGSIYVLDTDGSITKFTRGAVDDFTVSGLSTPLSSPTQIWANEDSDNIYVLDNGNARIVVLGNDGQFVQSYSADIISSATAFDIQEDAGEIFILSGENIYRIELQ